MNIVITDRQIGDIGDYRNYYLLQMNEVNGGDNVFVQCLSVCAQRTGQSDQFKTVKATNFIFDVHVPRDSLDMTP